MRTSRIAPAVSLVVLVALLLTLVPAPLLLAQESQGGGQTAEQGGGQSAQQGGGESESSTTTTRTKTTTWYADPVWITVGAVVLVLLILLIAMASRGGDRTTVVK